MLTYTNKWEFLKYKSQVHSISLSKNLKKLNNLEEEMN